MRKDTSKDQSSIPLLSEEQKKARKIDLVSLSKRMQERLDRLRGEHDQDGSFSKFKFQHTHQSV